MKRTFKKAISMFLALAIVVTCLPIVATNVEATSRTVNDAVSWIKARANEGWNVDVDGAYGCQCVDLIYAYYEYLGYSRMGGNACQYAEGSFGIPAGSGWYKDNTPSPGAIIAWPGNVWTGQWTTTWAGHVGLVYAVEGSTVYTVETNLSSPYEGGPARYCTRYPQNAVYIHPDFSGITPSIEYATITPSTYFLINKYDGKALTLGNNEDWNTNNVHAYQTAASNRGQYMVISAAPDGYKIRPIDSTRLVQPYGDHVFEGANVNIYDDVNDSSQWWKFEKTEGGYYIRNAQNTNLLLTNSYPNDCNAVIWSYGGGSDQIWELVPAVAPGKPVIKGVKSSYNQSESVVVDWDNTSDTNCYNIALERKENGEYKGIYFKENISHNYNLNSVVDLQPGDYRVRLASVNTKLKADYNENGYYLSTIGDYVNFTVKEKAAEAKGTIRIDNASASFGQTLKVPVYIDNAKISSLTFSVKYDPAVLEFVSADENAFEAVDVNVNNIKNGTITLACLNKETEINGKIVVLSFKTLAKASCKTSVEIFNTEAYDSKDNPIGLSESTAEISINTALLGDVNNDGKVNIIDARWLLQVSSGSRTLNDAQKAVSDVNGDKKVNIIDARWLLQVASGSRTL